MLAPAPTPASVAFSSLLPHSGGEGEGEEGVKEGEVCPEGLLAAKEVGRRVVGGGGAALIVDYGNESVARHTLRGFRGHRLHDVLVEPGSADMTADVDFGALSRAALGEGGPSHHTHLYIIAPLHMTCIVCKQGPAVLGQ